MVLDKEMEVKMVKNMIFSITLVIVCGILITACSPGNPPMEIGCSVSELIDAINTSNMDTTLDTIVLPAGCTYTLIAVDNELYSGPNGLPVITTPIKIESDASDHAVIARDTAETTPDFRLLMVGQDGDLTLQHVDLQGGQVFDDDNPANGNQGAGAGILNQGGVVRIEDVNVFNCIADTGGGIAGSGIMSITSSEIFGNTAGRGGGITHGGDLMIIASVVRDNTATESGAGIYNYGDLYMSSSLVEGNTAAEDGGGILNSSASADADIHTTEILDNSAENGYGGGISNINEAVLSISDGLVSGNQARFGGGINNGGTSGIDRQSASLFILESTIEDNTAIQVGETYTESFSAGLGGGIYANNGVTVISESTVFGNSATHGGGIYHAGDDPALLTVRLSTIEENNASLNGGGIHSNNDVLIEDSTIANNTAESVGGVEFTPFNEEWVQLTIQGSTITGNSANGVGGLFSSGQTIIINTTISGNQASGSVGGIEITGKASISHSTIVYNDSNIYAGVWVQSEGLLWFKNSIIAHNSPANCGAVAPASIDFIEENISDDGTCAGVSIQLNPQISGLADNGGPTQTHALLHTSPAIDIANSCTDLLGTPVTTDQRGVSRPTGTRCDLGAYEFSMEEPPPPEPRITFTLDTNCRAGPDSGYQTLTHFSVGDSAPVIGRNPDGTWWLVRLPLPPAPGVETCWVYDGTVERSFEPDDIPEGDLPAPMTETPSPTATSDFNCSQYHDQTSCEATLVCKWEGGGASAGACVRK